MYLQDIYNQDMNDKKELEYLIIHLTTAPFQFDLSDSMRLKLVESIEYRILEIDEKYNAPYYEEPDEVEYIDESQFEWMRDEHELNALESTLGQAE